jgi:putative DNA primase/helicase
VAKAMRDKYPDAKIIICADDDHRTEGNPGLTKAKEAAREIGAMLALPQFGSDRPAAATDFNDLAKLRGIEAVREQILWI